MGPTSKGPRELTPARRILATVIVLARKRYICRSKNRELSLNREQAISLSNLWMDESGGHRENPYKILREEWSSRFKLARDFYCNIYTPEQYRNLWL